MVESKWSETDFQEAILKVAAVLEVIQRAAKIKSVYAFLLFDGRVMELLTLL